MQAEQIFSFGLYRLDLAEARLWRGKQEVRLTGKAFAVLRYLVTHVGELVTKNDLFQAIWPETVVSDAALTSCIKELREILRDQAQERRYIETVHRRGFRFIGKVVSSQYSVASSPSSRLIPNPQSLTPSFVGRTAELTQLHGWLAKALSGERQIVFVTGEPGIGKTSLVEAFLQSLESNVQGQEERQNAKGKGQKAKVSEAQSSALNPQSLSSPTPNPQHPTPLLGRGQCIEHYGTGEPYLPLLEALGRLCREPDGAHLVAVLKQHAPTWLVQLPSLLTTEEATALQGKTAGATQVRMLRELAEAIEEMTRERPLVLWLEDLHWSDVSTLDWLAFLARRRERARLMIIGTYRPVEVLAHEHPLKAVKQELHLHGQCQELAVDFLREEHVAEYLVRRFAVGVDDRAPFHRLACTIHQRTDGNPLFMVNVVDQLLSQGVFVQVGEQWTVQKEEDAVGAMPESLRQMIERQVERLSTEDQQVLEAASVAGVEFSVAAIAAGVGTEPDAVEDQCTKLARREQFLRLAGTNEWPDGTVATRYSFLHALYQDVLYHRLTARRRQRLHQQIGEREEAAYGERAREIAAELAVHFEQGCDYRKAVQYLQQAGENAVRRSANHEAISLFTKGLELLKTLPDTPERTQQELRLQVALSVPLAATKGWAAPEVGQTCTRARELCQQVDEPLQLFPVLYGLWGFYLMRADFQTARELGDQLFTLAQNVQDPALLLQAHFALGPTLFPLGELISARAHLEKGLALYDSQKSHSYPLRTMMSKVTTLTIATSVLWSLGYPEQALERDHEALTLAQELAHSQSLAIALVSGGWLHQFRREGQAAQARAEAAIALSNEQGFAQLLALGTIQRGWALTEQGQEEEGLAQLRQGLAACRATGAELYRSGHLALLAEAHGRRGQSEEGLKVLAEALTMVEKNEERWYEAELYRLKGELTLQQESQKSKGKRQKQLSVVSSQLSVPNAQSPTSKAHSEAEACFLKAIDISRKQQAKSLELRAAMSLARLWRQQGKTAEAHRMLSEIYGWFTEGFDTKDLQEAKALLEGVSRTLD